MLSSQTPTMLKAAIGVWPSAFLLFSTENTGQQRL
jgi:hypothetical protein